MASKAGPGRSFVVRSNSARIEEIPFTELPESAWQGVDARLDLIIPGGPTLAGVALGTLWFCLGIGFYLMYGLVALLKGLLGRGK